MADAVRTRNSALLAWYSQNGRDLPWRLTNDPYPVMVSEFMLQQTQVARVIPRFSAFLDAFPTVNHLARATTTDLLAHWSGLGYNRRALRLREASRIVASDGWPTTAKELRVLPGVGPYTAAAIASIAFDEQVPAVDTNLRRVLSRWHGAPLDGVGLDAEASRCVGDDAGAWNQALMDLGSTLCTVRQPSCGTCPVAKWCNDPTVYEPPQRQSAFEGSRRQLRGAMVRAHLDGHDPVEVGRALGRSMKEIRSVLEDLADEGLIRASDAGHASGEDPSLPRQGAHDR